jgi:hypothetical protein
MKKQLVFVAAFAGAVLVGAAYAAKPLTTRDESNYSFTYECADFRVSVDGHNTGAHTIYFDNGGNKVRNVGHHHITEMHRNLGTGRTVEFRGNYTSTYDYAVDTQTFKGAFLIGNAPMDGTLLQEVGLVEFNNTTGEIRTAGRHDILNLPYDPFCAALSG